jgi:hypothetical protein
MAKQAGIDFLQKLFSAEQKTGTRWRCAGFLPFRIKHGH